MNVLNQFKYQITQRKTSNNQNLKLCPKHYKYYITVCREMVDFINGK